jgi:hypothetical protein
MELGSKEFWERLSLEPELLAAEICSVDVVNLDLTMQHHAALRAWVNAAHESARIEEGKAEFEVTKARARATLNGKAVKDPHTEKAKTVEVLKAETETDPEVVRLTDILFVAQEKRGVLRAMSNALEDRLQMLIQISAKQRLEIRDSQHYT